MSGSAGESVMDRSAGKKVSGGGEGSHACADRRGQEHGCGGAGHPERAAASGLAHTPLLMAAPELEGWDELSAQVPQRRERRARIDDALDGSDDDEQNGWV